jgi:hypothetical protein
MGRFLAGFLGLLGLGVIIHGVLAKAPLGWVRPSLPMVLVPLLALFCLGTWWQARLKRGKVSAHAELVGESVFRGFLFIAALGLLAAIPALWWGVIKTLAGIAHEGGKFM